MIVEKIRRVTLTNGLVRMEAVTFGPNGEEQLAGVIQLPASQAGNVLENMHSALQRLQQGQSGNEGPSAAPEGTGSQVVRVGPCNVHMRRNLDVDGPPVVMLHGAKFSAQTWEELGTLDKVAEAGFQPWALDLPGYGESPSCEEQPIRVVASFLSSFKQSTILVGPSMGGQLALDIALRAPHLLSGLVLVAPVQVKQFADQLAKIEVPTLVVWGNQDQVADPAHAETLKAGMPDARVEIIEGGNHPCYLDDPERWHSLLTGFLTERFGQNS